MEIISAQLQGPALLLIWFSIVLKNKQIIQTCDLHRQGTQHVILHGRNVSAAKPKSRDQHPTETAQG